jgi:hypothetical protein
LNITVNTSDRERFLSELREMSGGDTDRPVPTTEIAQRPGVPADQDGLIAESLHTGLPGSARHRLLEPGEGEDYASVSITEEGRKVLDDFSDGGVRPGR